MCYCFKNLIQFFKESTKETKQHIFYHCSDSPYGLISFELLTKIRQSIEKTKDPKDKKTLNELRFKLIHLERKLKLMKEYKINSLDKRKRKSDKKKKKKKSPLKNNKVIINNNNKINIPGLKELHLLLKNHDSDLF